MKIHLEPGYILHHYPYRDTSLLLEVFTRHHGRVGLVARGARSGRSRLRGLLQVFSPLLLSWHARGEQGTLSGAETNGPVAVLPGKRIMSAYYLNELLLRMMTRNDPHPDLFTSYASAIDRLASGEAGEITLRMFEKSLLQELGYGLLLDQDAETGHSVNPDDLYEYKLEKGPVAVTRSSAGGLCFNGRSLLALHRGELDDPASLRDARLLMRHAIALYTGKRPLRTREVLRQWTVSQ